MAKVLGIGGVFFKAKDPAALSAWYGRVLGLQVESWGGVFFPAAALASKPGAGSVFSPFAEKTEYFTKSSQPFMVNLCVDDLEGLLARAKTEGVEPTKLTLDDPSGRFAHLLDPEGNAIELWEPLAPKPG